MTTLIPSLLLCAALGHAAPAFKAVSAEQAGGVRQLLLSATPGKTAISAGVLDELGRKRFDTQLEGRRALLAPFVQAQENLQARGLPADAEAVYAEGLRLIDERVDAAVAASEKPEATQQELDAAYSDAKGLVWIAGLFRASAFSKLVDAMSSANARLDALRSQAAAKVAAQSRNFSADAFELMARDGRDLSASYDLLRQVSNEHQLSAIRTLIDGSNDGISYNVAEKMPAILRFDNPHQVRALALMVADGRSVKHSMEALASIANEHQVAAIKTLLDGSGEDMNYQIANKLPAILDFSNALQVEALELMVGARRKINPSIDALSKIGNAHQVEAIAALLGAAHFSGGTYEVAPKLPAVLRFDDALQVEALKTVLDAKLSVKGLMEALAGVKTPEQLALVRAYVAAVKPPVWDDAAVRRAWLGLLFSSLPSLLALSMVHAFAFIDALFAGGAITVMGVGLYLLRAAILKAREGWNAGLEANRAALSARPEIEAGLGPIDEPDLIAPRR